MEKICIYITVLLFSSIAQAYNMSVAIIKTNTEYDALVIMQDKPCEKDSSNIKMMTGSEGKEGCWKKVDNQIIISWNDNSQSMTLDSSIFRIIGNTDKESTNIESKASNTFLTCASSFWNGDIEVKRDKNKILKELIANGESVQFSENSTSINFTQNKTDINLSTLTGIFTYETNFAFGILNGGKKERGRGNCQLNQNTKRF